MPHDDEDTTERDPEIPRICLRLALRLGAAASLEEYEAEFQRELAALRARREQEGPCTDAIVIRSS